MYIGLNKQYIDNPYKNALTQKQPHKRVNCDYPQYITSPAYPAGITFSAQIQCKEIVKNGFLIFEPTVITGEMNRYFRALGDLGIKDVKKVQKGKDKEAANKILEEANNTLDEAKKGIDKLAGEGKIEKIPYTYVNKVFAGLRSDNKGVVKLASDTVKWLVKNDFILEIQGDMRPIYDRAFTVENLETKYSIIEALNSLKQKNLIKEVPKGKIQDTHVNNVLAGLCSGNKDIVNLSSRTLKWLARNDFLPEIKYDMKPIYNELLTVTDPEIENSIMQAVDSLAQSNSLKEVPEDVIDFIRNKTKSGNPQETIRISKEAIHSLYNAKLTSEDLRTINIKNSLEVLENPDKFPKGLNSVLKV